MKELKKRKRWLHWSLLTKNKAQRSYRWKSSCTKQREDYLKEYYEIQKQKNDEKKATLQKQAEVKNSDIQPQEKIVKTENVEKLKEVKKKRIQKKKLLPQKKFKPKVVKENTEIGCCFNFISK